MEASIGTDEKIRRWGSREIGRAFELKTPRT
jgi:hypothetical protein